MGRWGVYVKGVWENPERDLIQEFKMFNGFQSLILLFQDDFFQWFAFLNMLESSRDKYYWHWSCLKKVDFNQWLGMVGTKQGSLYDTNPNFMHCRFFWKSLKNEPIQFAACFVPPIWVVWWTLTSTTPPKKTTFLNPRMEVWLRWCSVSFRCDFQVPICSFSRGYLEDHPTW